MTIGVSDLSIITDKLLETIRVALNGALSGTASVTGAMPETVRADGGCQVCLYLYHVSLDPNVRNSAVVGPEKNRQRSFGLELFYMLTVFAGKDYVTEQHAMSIAMRALFDNPIVRIVPPPPAIGSNPGDVALPHQLTITLEDEKVDKLGILWQSASAPFRLTAIYKAAIALLEPTEKTPSPNPPPKTFALVAPAAEFPIANAPIMAGTWCNVTYKRADGTPAGYDLSPAVVAPGSQLRVIGTAFGDPIWDHLYLQDANGGSEREVTGWRVPIPNSSPLKREVNLVQVPVSVGPGVDQSPPPGIYLLQAGTGIARTNFTPFSIAPFVAVGPTGPPILAENAGFYLVNGAGFVSGKTEIVISDVSLTESAGAPADGEFQVLNAGESLRFPRPFALPAGKYAMRVRVNGVEAPPSWWVVIP